MRSGWLVCGLAAACTFAPTAEDWASQLHADGPCYDVNILDGLDETSTGELHDLFACVNGNGALDAYGTLDVALDGTTRDGIAGVVFARWFNALPTADVDPAALLAQGIAVLEDPADLLAGARLALELVYAEPWEDLGTTVPMNSQISLDSGLLVPLLPAVGAAVQVILDDTYAPLAPVVDALRSPLLRDAAWTLASLGVSEDPVLAGIADGWATDVADFLRRTRDESDDRWADASGDALRDLTEALLTQTGNDGRLALEHVADPLLPLLGDDDVRDDLSAALAREVSAGRIDPVGREALHLVSVDTLGGALSEGESSALVALIRLLHDGNTDVVCTFDYGLGTFDISLGNLSVQLLETLADTDPDTVVGSVDLLGDLLGYGLTDDMLDAVADGGTCPAIDAQLVSDLHALDRFNDTDAGTLLYVLLAVLDAARDRIPELVDLVSTLHDFGLVEPIEELVRATATSALVSDVLTLVPVLLEPDRYHEPALFPAGIEPLDFDAAWQIAESTLEEMPALTAVLNAVITQDTTWAAVGNLAHLLGDPRAEVAGVLPGLHEVLALDPDLAVADTLADTLESPALVRAPLVLLEGESLRAAIGATALTEPGPIPFTAQLVRGGTLDRLLVTLRLLATFLPPETP